MRTKESKTRNERGVTLIALVVTIIVLLILAGVTIVALSGDNGILQNATKAKEENRQASIEEKIKLLSTETIIDQYAGQNEEKTAEELQSELNSQGENVLVVQWDKYIIFDLNENKEYRVTSDGEVEYYGESIMGNVLKNTTTPNFEQKESRNEGYIGIGTDGNTVNLDLWEYAIDDGIDNSKGYGLNDETWFKTETSEVRTCGYITGENEKNIINGKIKGCVPMFIKNIESNYWIAITSMSATFYNIKSLITPPELPNTVISLRETFLNCEELISMPEIPSNVINMRSTFNGCSKLINVKDIPNKVTDMGSTYQNCTSLESFGTIPDSVILLTTTFYNCKNLKTIEHIGNEVKDMSRAFANCLQLSGIPNIPQSVENMTMAFSNCNNITNVNIMIPITVQEFEGAFATCRKMQGNVEINANPQNYKYCFLECATDGTGLTIRGTSEILQNLKEAYVSNDKIKFE